MTYAELLKDVKLRIRQAQIKAVVSANAEMLLLYWEIGRMIHARQDAEGWGSGVIPRLARDIKNELTDVKGFSESNLNRMLAFYREYPHFDSIAILPPPVAKLGEESGVVLPPAVAKLDNSGKSSMLRVSWACHVVLMERIKDVSTRSWYIQQILEHGWTLFFTTSNCGALSLSS